MDFVVVVFRPMTFCSTGKRRCHPEASFARLPQAGPKDLNERSLQDFEIEILRRKKCASG